jgi:hypothetical protein
MTNFEAGCIEAVHSDTPVPLTELLDGTSYSDQWVPEIVSARKADAAICVYPPNHLRQPHLSSVEFIGAFPYEL